MQILFVPFHTTQEYNYANYIPEVEIHRLGSWHEEMRPIPGNVNVLPKESTVRLADYEAVLMSERHLATHFSEVDLTDYEGKIILANDLHTYPTNEKMASIQSFLSSYKNTICFVPEERLAQEWEIEEDKYVKMCSVPPQEFREASWNGRIHKLLIVDSQLMEKRGMTSRGLDLIQAATADIVPWDILGWGNEDLTNSLGAKKEMQKLISYYANYRLYCSGKISNSLPFDNSTLEACAVGMPVVLGKEQEYIEKYDNLLFATANPMKLRDRMQLYLENVEVAKEASEKSQELVERYFSYEEYKERFREVIKS